MHWVGFFLGHHPVMWCYYTSRVDEQVSWLLNFFSSWKYFFFFFGWGKIEILIIGFLLLQFFSSGPCGFIHPGNPLLLVLYNNELIVPFESDPYSNVSVLIRNMDSYYDKKSGVAILEKTTCKLLVMLFYLYMKMNYRINIKLITFTVALY